MTKVHDSILRRLRDCSSAYFGVPFVGLQLLRRIESEASVVLQVRVDGAPGTGDIFVKLFKADADAPGQRERIRQRLINDFETSRRVYQQMSGRDGFAAVRAIACFPDELALVTERAPGRTLGELLRREAVWWPRARPLAQAQRAMLRVGAWLRAFQGSGADGRFSLTGMRTYIDARLCRLTGLPRAKFPHAWRAGVLEYFDRRAADVTGDDLSEVAVHADIAPGNVLLDGDRVTVIDFAMATTGGRFHDVARLYTQLEFLTYKPQFRRPVVTTLQSALLEGFQPGVSPSHPLFELFLVQHTICHLANLSSHPGSGPSRVYNWYQCRQHRRTLQAICRLPHA